ncbi:hypothetical protein [Flavobacterium johnsoniae]|uniref:Uncharacterized protein n=1 Tax=Flavobacterium johnsoniae (strain ATCC 17061 / DSM 2064 / JCM 8514 / BCRC 14874 / CCUG 350202 / NBRC 14942 / NCIMB 11054 / UW101) TaxID=376686 RepID=A5FGF7_FLAJ1|nr:hypothetical protein [Flavobacterium johnsoniae]ABQ05715.1 hypothetical protein Fjoh_2692 [Flavobacterium johnsoniae UW101]OXE95299.1 hypothetical protein B0A63_24875 [Flavobacterium johnsoniae UW101]WQG81452.1 hypothetical protein SR927_25990 [Flavobacterium johnsoniae UW101]SHM04640.1 hypothetical protein SAMN05444146_5250 [Flavobacterium johnsoniae]
MENRKLEIYTFIAHPNRKPTENVVLEDVFGNDLYLKLKNGFPNFVDTFPPLQIDDKTAKIEKIKNGNEVKSIFKFNDSLRYIAGKIMIGDDDGKEQDVVESNKEKTVLYTKKKGQSVERPYYFMIIVPLGLKYGFIVLEREGKHSAKGVFDKLFRKFVYENLSGLNCKISNFVESEIIKEYLEFGQYNSITLSQKIISSDKAEQYLGTYIDGSKYKVELRIIPLENSVIPFNTKKKILKNLENNEGFFEGTEFRNIGFDDDANVKVVATKDGNTRTIDLEDTFKVRPYYVINVANNNKGFSDFKNINKEAKKLIRGFDLNIL